MNDNKNVNQPVTRNIVWLDWPAPSTVKACYSLRSGGYSSEAYRSFNFGDHVEDIATNVEKNRKKLQEIINQQEIVWLQQVHGTNVVGAECGNGRKADACYTQKLNQVCNVMTADCLPVFFCDTDGTQVAMAHAGWRGLHAGVLAQTLKQFNQYSHSNSQSNPKASSTTVSTTISKTVSTKTSSNKIIAYLGPAISQAAFEVGDDVRDAFLSLPHDQLKQGRQYFKAGRCRDADKSDIENSNSNNLGSSSDEQKWMADLYGIAKDMLSNMGVSEIYGGDRCTYSESDDFFSYRRDGRTGRMANLIWLE